MRRTSHACGAPPIPPHTRAHTAAHTRVWLNSRRARSRGGHKAQPDRRSGGGGGRPRPRKITARAPGPTGRAKGSTHASPSRGQPSARGAASVVDAAPAVVVDIPPTPRATNDHGQRTQPPPLHPQRNSQYNSSQQQGGPAPKAGILPPSQQPRPPPILQTLTPTNGQGTELTSR